jgi:hypothetical protein
MDRENRVQRGDLRLVARPELAHIMERLADPACRGALLLGEPGTGKTTLLAKAGDELRGQGRAVTGVSVAGLRDAGELGRRMLEQYADPGIGRTLRSSAGGPSLDEAVAILRNSSSALSRPIVLLDGIDEAPYPSRMVGAIEQLIFQLEGWQFIVTSSQEAAGELRRFVGFEVVVLGNLGEAIAANLLRAYVPDLPDEIISRMIAFTGGQPVLLQVVARELGQRSSEWEAETGGPSSFEHALGWLVDEAVKASPDPEKKGLLLEELALAGGRDTIAHLASKTHLTAQEVRNLLSAPQARALVTVDESAATASFFHASLRDVIVSRRILKVPFKLADLKFGDEAAERDDLLSVSYVQRPSAKTILGQNQTIVVGDRGSGKSAIFRKLTEDAAPAHQQRRAEICPVTNTGDLLHKIIADDKAWLDTDALRAAWLVVVAALVAKTAPASTPKNLRRDAAALRAALGFPAEAGTSSLAKRALAAIARLVGGTTLKFTVGPAELEVQLPTGSTARTAKAPVDVDSFLRETDALLGESDRRTVVMFDRIDEAFKYDRPRQQTVVQALLQAEAQVSLLENVQLIVFLRTDLFELYDIQEKNKLVSRTFTIEWAEEEWLQVLVRRVLANEPLERLARRLNVADGGADVRAGLEVLFPAEIEGQPVDRWLIDSLRNGNGDVSPRLAVLLLYLARQRAARPDAVVSALPLFSSVEAGEAMTKLSDLSFSEVVNDFKVGPSFVQNCRAGKLETFALDDVRDLFDEAEGKISDQVRLLERLGFLERVVRQRSTETGTVRESLFRIPRLYTRCWGHA